jgi:hypothetical protein
MLDIEISSLNRKIQKTKNLSPFVELMLENWERWPLELYFSLKNRLLDGYILEEGAYAKIVCVTRSKTLYEARTFHGFSSLYSLLEAGIPDESVELKICENVESEFYAKYSTHLHGSFETLALYGSTGALEILEILAYDNAPAHQVAKIKNNLFNDVDFTLPQNQDYTIQFEQISASLKVTYYTTLIETISKIKERGLHPEDRFVDWSTI